MHPRLEGVIINNAYRNVCKEDKRFSVHIKQSQIKQMIWRKNNFCLLTQSPKVQSKTHAHFFFSAYLTFPTIPSSRQLLILMPCLEIYVKN